MKSRRGVQLQRRPLKVHVQCTFGPVLFAGPAGDGPGVAAGAVQPDGPAAL